MTGEYIFATIQCNSPCIEENSGLNEIQVMSKRNNAVPQHGASSDPFGSKGSAFRTESTICPRSIPGISND